MEFIAKEEGYLMTYTANQTNEDLNVFMDDMTVTHTTGPIVRVDDYYPFGLTFNSSLREESLTNKFTFQGQEKQEETGWYSFKWRNHQPDIGRFFNVDPLASDYVHNSPYAFSENKVIAHIELKGLEAVSIQLEGRVSIPVSLVGGFTGSGAVGIALDAKDIRKNGMANGGIIKGMIYQSYSLGGQGGIYAGGGLEANIMPTAGIEDLKGFGVNLGASLNPNLTGGPDVGGEINSTLPTDKNGNIIWGDIKAGGTIAPSVSNLGVGGTVYMDFSYTDSVLEFQFNLQDTYDGFVESSGEALEMLYNLMQDTNKEFDMKYEDFQRYIYDQYQNLINTADDSNDN